MTVLRHIDKALARLEGWLIVLFLGLMVSLTFLQVILRALYAYAHLQWANSLMGTLSWSEPLTRLLVLWLTFLGASLVTGENKHVRIDLLTGLLPPRWRPLRSLLLSLACGLVCAFMIRASFQYVGLEMRFGGSLFLGIPTWVGQIVLPMGFTVMFFRCLLKGIQDGLVILRGKQG